MPLAGTATDRGRFFPEPLRLACDVRIRGFSAVGSGHGCRERFLSKAHRSRPVYPLPVSGHYPGEELRAALESRVQVLQESRAELRARAGRDLDAAGSTRPGSAEVPPSMLVRPAAPPIAESRVNQPAYAAINTRRSAATPIATNRTHTVSPLLSAASQPGRYRAGPGRRRPDAVYAVQETLFALSSRHGTRLWSFAANAGPMAYPLLAGGVIYVPGSSMYGTSSLMLAVRASDGIKLWESPGPGGGWLACDGTTVCAVSGLRDAGPGLRKTAGRFRPGCGLTGPVTAS